MKSSCNDNNAYLFSSIWSKIREKKTLLLYYLVSVWACEILIWKSQDCIFVLAIILSNLSGCRTLAFKNLVWWRGLSQRITCDSPKNANADSATWSISTHLSRPMFCRRRTDDCHVSAQCNSEALFSALNSHQYKQSYILRV